MHYYIDGYNLLFKILRSHESLQEAREMLIEELNMKASVTKMPITVVFDAHYQEENLSITHYRDLEIIYSSYSQTADDLIIKLLKSLDNPRSCTLVTSDNKLAWRARQLLVKTEKVESFLKLLNRRYENKIQEKEVKPQTLKVPPRIKPQKSKNNEGDYEEIFSERHAQFEAKRCKNKPAIKIKPQKETTKRRYLNDFDRWLDIFEKRVKEDEGNGA